MPAPYLRKWKRAARATAEAMMSSCEVALCRFGAQAAFGLLFSHQEVTL